MPTAPPNNSTRPPDKSIELYYEQDGDPSGKPLLLIMGLSSQLIAWPSDLVADLANRASESFDLTTGTVVCRPTSTVSP